jgi:5-formyltetrahydrofolate cyclo-ligase
MINDHFIEETKGDFRKKCLDRLRFIAKNGKYKKDKIVALKLKEIIFAHNFKNILLYIPLKSEVDVMPILNLLKKSKKHNVYVPYMTKDSFKIVNYRLPLKLKKFGIKEPPNSTRKAKIDLAIVPIVGVDKLNKRVGFGKGMYDRFFDGLNKKPTIIFVQLELCKCNKILSSKYDIQSDLIVTS